MKKETTTCGKLINYDEFTDKKGNKWYIIKSSSNKESEAGSLITTKDLEKIHKIKDVKVLEPGETVKIDST